MPRRIIVNGREYASPADLPPDLRQAYDRATAALGDANHNGVPDALEAVVTETHTATRIVVNGQEYASVEAMPPAVRCAYEQVRAQLEGRPDSLWNSLVVEDLELKPAARVAPPPIPPAARHRAAPPGARPPPALAPTVAATRDPVRGRPLPAPAPAAPAAVPAPALARPRRSGAPVPTDTRLLAAVGVILFLLVVGGLLLLWRWWGGQGG